ncbi:hypothetical protein Leryth_013222 [Lithospermum erythrorhizon]|nr:hypothetical protein Leryth_013222 [Lithospermum erythrorhizon]
MMLKTIFSFPKNMSPMSLLLLLMVLINCLASCNAQLSPTFYSQTCSNATTTIRTIIRRAISAERRMAASLIRLHFHDCFVQGCDASVLLDDAPGIDTEELRGQMRPARRPYLELRLLSYFVLELFPKLRPSSSSYGFICNGGRTFMDGAFSTLPTLISSFAAQGLNQREMVVLSGAHTLGQARCLLFRARIYNATNIDAGFASTRRRQCPVTGGNANLAPLDLVTPNSFDNNYFKNLIQLKGLLPSDQVLFNGGSADSVVTAFSNSPSTFASEFAAAMIKMGDISPLTGQNGIIRRVCNAIN